MFIVQNNKLGRKAILCIIRIFVVYDIIPTGFIKFLFKHFDCVTIGDSFSNTTNFVFFSGPRCALQKTNREMV